MNLRYKIIALFILIALIPVLTMSAIFINQASNILERYSLAEAEEEVELVSLRVELFLENAENDILFLSNTDNLRKLINSPNIYAANELIQSVSNDFAEFSKAKEKYYQIRYIDEIGQEIVRIDNKYDKIYTIEESELQNKANRHYFQDSIDLKEGEIFTSVLDLNVEKEEVENRGTEINPEYVPVIRYATPVYNDQGFSKGIIITNIYADFFLKFFQELEQEANGEIILVDEDGYYFYNQDESKTWGSILGIDEKLGKDYPEINLDSLGEKDQLEFQDIIISHKTIHPSQEEDWELISIYPKDVIFSPIKRTIVNTLLLSGVVILIMIIIGLLSGSYITSPIKDLTIYADELSSGNIRAKLPAKISKRKDEIGKVAKAFKLLVRSSGSDVEKSIEQKIKGVKKNRKKANYVNEESEEIDEELQ